MSDDIIIDLKETSLDGIDLFNLAQDMDKWQAVMNIAIKCESFSSLVTKVH
jgi:hypothetical protein